MWSTSFLSGRHVAIALVLLVSSSGCGGVDYGKPVDVSGTLSMDSNPLGEVTVIFHATSSLPAEFRTRRAKTDAQGAFAISDVYPAEYTVIFERAMKPVEDPGSAPAAMDVKVDPLVHYVGKQAPSATVSESSTEFTFDLKSNPAPE